MDDINGFLYKISRVGYETKRFLFIDEQPLLVLSHFIIV